jgi:beta-lactam-binding protein with PASTA domain
VYYDLEEPIHRRPVWPWIAAFLFVLAAGVGGWFLYSQISNKFAANNFVPVKFYVDMREQQARDKITADGFTPVVNHHSSRKTPAGFVFMQKPIQGKRIRKGDPVTIWVSTGVPKVDVPSLVGKQGTDAVAELTLAHLKPVIREVPSTKPAGEVTGQDPPAGTKQPEGSVVHFNVSKGPTPVSVPNVVGQPVATATSTLQAQGFKVSQTYVDSAEPANNVISQNPAADQSAGKGSLVTLTVSNGPTTSIVPDVTSQDFGAAQQTLHDSGFNAKFTYQDTPDPNSEGLVLAQDPVGGTQAKPGSSVTLSVGRYRADTTQTTTPTP